MCVYDNRGPIVRLIWLCSAIVWWIAARCGLVRQPAVVTLCYHGVTSHQQRRFECQMKSLADRAVSIDAAGSGQRDRWVRPSVCVTLDDGFANLLDYALPATRKLGVPVTVFVVTENLGSLPKWAMEYEQSDAAQLTMSESQITRAATDPLCRFASHSLTHPRLTDIPLSQARRELADSRTQLAHVLGQPVDDFAFPHGDCSAQLITEAFASGYRRVHTLGPIWEGFDRSRGQVIARMKMSPDVWMLEFRLTVSGAYEWLWLVRRVLHRLGRLLDAESQATGPVHPANAPRG